MQASIDFTLQLQQRLDRSRARARLCTCTLLYMSDQLQVQSSQLIVCRIKTINLPSRPVRHIRYRRAQLVDGDGRHGRLYRLLLVLTPFPRAAGFFFCGFRFLASSSSDSEAELSSELEADDESSSEPDSDSESDSDPESELGESAARFLEFLFGAGFLGDAAGGFFEDAEDDFLLVGFGFNFGVAVFFAGPLRDAAAAGFFFALPAVFFPAGDSSSALSSSDSASDASESDSESVSLLDFFDCFEVFFC